MKKYTVKELAPLLDDYIAVVFNDEFDNWSTHEMFDTLQELVNKYGERTINWISWHSEEDEIYQLIGLEGGRE